MEEICRKMGMNLTTAITIFCTKVVQERRIPFEINADPDPFYSESNIRYLEKKTEDYKAGRLKLAEHELIGEEWLMQIKQIQWDFNAWEEYCEWQQGNKAVLKHINALIKDIWRKPFEGIGKPEPLKENLSGFGAAVSMVNIGLSMCLIFEQYS